MRARPDSLIGRRYGRLLALVAVPTATLAASVRPRLSTRAPGAAQITLTPAGIALVAIAAAGVTWLGILLFLQVRPRRHRDDTLPRIVAWQPSHRAQLAALLVVVSVIGAAVALVIAMGRHHIGAHQPAQSSVRPVSPTAAPTASAPAGHSSSPSTLTILVVGGVLVIAGAAGLFTHRHGRRVVELVPPDSPEPTLEHAVDEGLRQGAAAFATTDDVRLAITRCYAAMERGLDDAGLPGSPVRTPTEALDAAIRQRLLPAAPATVLTRLFERARFSTDPLTTADRDAARDALEALRTEVPR